MKRFTTFSILCALLIPFFFSGCKDDAEETPFNDSIPSSGLYFKMKIGDKVWEGNNMPEMFVKKEPEGETSKMLDFIVCTDDETNTAITVLGQRLYLHAKVNDNGSLSNYNIVYKKNATTTYPTSFDEYMNYKSGTLSVISQTDDKITAKFVGVLSPVNDYAEDVSVIIYFQEFPLDRVKKKLQ